MAAPIAAAAVPIATAVIGAGGQIAASAARNRKQWKYQQRAMNLQQELNLEAWNLQNQYNSPQETMRRLQEAGLNPRLVYGSGANAGGPAGPLQAPEAPVRQAPDIPQGAPDLMTYYQIRQMDAQYRQTNMATDLMQKRGALIDIQEGLKNLELFKETIRSKNYSGVVEMEQAMQRFLTSRAKSLALNEKRKGENLLTQGYLMDQLVGIRGEQVKGIQLDNAFKQYRNELSKLGIHTSDHPALRVLIQASRRMNIDLGELLMEGASNLKYLLDMGN